MGMRGLDGAVVLCSACEGVGGMCVRSVCLGYNLTPEAVALTTLG